MKKTATLLTALVSTAVMYAQNIDGTATVRARQDMIKVLPGNIVYLMPEFSEGTSTLRTVLRVPVR